MNGKTRLPSRKRAFAAVAVAIAAAIAATAAIRHAAHDGEVAAMDGELFATARRGRLVIDLSEDGEIKPSQQIILKSAVEGRHAIIYIIPEGSIVKKGDLLVELDVATTSEERANQEIVVTNAASALEMKREDLEIARNQADSDVELAELDLAFAKEDLEKYEKGEYPNKLDEARGNVTLAEQELEQAKEKYEWSRKLHAEDFLSASELKTDELSWRHRELALATARGTLSLLETYTHKRELARLESDVRQKTAALERTRRKAASSILQAESALRARESEYSRQKQRLEKLETQIANARITAPMDGQVIYSTSTQRPWENAEPLKEGVEVWERRDLIILPTADTFIASAVIRESALKSVTTGMPVEVTCDAVPDAIFDGTLTKIAPMPDTARRWMNPDIKEYPAEISIADGRGALKNGLGCHVKIRIAEYEDAVSVPIQCVVRIGGAAYVWVKTPRGPRRRAVETGLDNNRFVHIVSGLDGGEEVMLAPPLADSAPEG